MDLPSMVERAGDKLIVRSLVTGASIYDAQKTDPLSIAGTGTYTKRHPLVDAELLEHQLELYRHNANSSIIIPSPLSAASSFTGLETEETIGDDLPQCKIRRNYSCTHCSYFTQNPRNHLSHLRDVHGERIVINECKLCLYASRHFQKLVRHLKMVHGCAEDTGSVGSGKRSGLREVREVRKRRLEESVDPANLAKMMQSGPSLEQLKSELQIQEEQLLHNMQAYNRLQDFQQLHSLMTSNNNIFSIAYEMQSRAQNQLQLLLPLPVACKKTAAIEMEAENSSSDTEESTLPEIMLPTSSDAKLVETTPSNEPLDLSSTSPTKYCCKQCTYTTPVKSRFKKHVKYHSMPLIKCDSCDFQTPYKWNLDRHTKNHGGDGNFRCTICNFSTDIKQSLTIHVLNHHVPKTGAPISNSRRAQRALAAEHTIVDNSGKSTNIHAVTDKKQDTMPVKENDASNAVDASRLLQLAPNPCSDCPHTLPKDMENSQTFSPSMCNTNHHVLTNTADLEGDMSRLLQNDATTDLGANSPNFCGVETAPGYGKVTEDLPTEDAETLTALKKVFKCPHCTFWAATASRFHVHIVGHLNKKPFECSLCAYRSNWRWDITKHIRLKALRDTPHLQAEVLMNDETGRRNYAKYNQYLTLMKVNTDSGMDAKALRSGEWSKSYNDVSPGVSRPSLYEMDCGEAIQINDAEEEEINDNFGEAMEDTDDVYCVPSEQIPDLEMGTQVDDKDTVNQNELIKKTLFDLEYMGNVCDADKEMQNEDNTVKAGKTFRCDLCDQSSNWKHVIQRQSRLIEKSVNDFNEKLATESTKKLISYCNYCPARFGQASLHDFSYVLKIGRHIAAHKQEKGPKECFSCLYCSYQCETDADLSSHLIVHTTWFQEETESLQQTHQADPLFPAPMVKKVDKNDMEEFVWIVEETNQVATNSSVSIASFQEQTGAPMIKKVCQHDMKEFSWVIGTDDVAKNSPEHTTSFQKQTEELNQTHHVDSFFPESWVDGTVEVATDSPVQATIFQEETESLHQTHLMDYFLPAPIVKKVDKNDMEEFAWVVEGTDEVATNSPVSADSFDEQTDALNQTHQMDSLSPAPMVKKVGLNDMEEFSKVGTDKVASNSNPR